MKHLKRCKHCTEWTDGSLDACTHCGHELDKEYKAEVQKRLELGDPRMPVIRVREGDPLWLKALKRPVQLVQLVLYGIIALLVYLTTVFAH